MSLPSIRRIWHVLSPTCLVYALTIGPAFGALGCESLNALPMDFATVRDKLIRTLEAHDTSYFDRLLAPGIAFDDEEEVRDPLALIERKPYIRGRPRVNFAIYVLSLRGRCGGGVRRAICKHVQLSSDANVRRTWKNGSSNLVARGSGACGRSAPHITAPIVAKIGPGQPIELSGGEFVDKPSGTWARYTHGNGFVYFYVEELNISWNNLSFNWILFRKIGGLWRIVEFPRNVGD